MIKHLSGIILHKSEAGIILSCQGVGYGVDVPFSSLAHLPETGQNCELWIYTRVREDGIALYGFLTYEDRQVFELLLNISGVGPKVAIGILSAMDIDLLKSVAQSKNYNQLEQVPGIGRRSAEKILLELHGKLDRFPQSSSRRFASLPHKFQPSLNFDASIDAEKVAFNALRSDILSALTHLGFKEKQIKQALDQKITYPSHYSLSEGIKICLSVLTKDQGLVSQNSRDIDTLF